MSIQEKTINNILALDNLIGFFAPFYGRNLRHVFLPEANNHLRKINLSLSPGNKRKFVT